MCHSWSFYSGKFKSIQSMSLPVWLPQEIENLQKSLETAKKDHRLGVGCPVQVQDCTLFRSKGICSKRCCCGSFRHSVCWSGAISYLLNVFFFWTFLWNLGIPSIKRVTFVCFNHPSVGKLSTMKVQPSNILANWAQFIDVYGNHKKPFHHDSLISQPRILTTVKVWESQKAAISSRFP